MVKKGADFAALCLLGNNVNREKYAGTGYFHVIGAMGGRAGRGVKKPRGGPAARKAARKAARCKAAPQPRSGLESATMREVLAELER